MARLSSKPCSGLIATDLDATLVDSNGDPGLASNAVRQALHLGYYVVPVTSKSIFEIAELWDEIGIPEEHRLAIVESGGAIYAPKGVLSRPTGFNREVGLEYRSLGVQLERLEPYIGEIASLCKAKRLSMSSPREAAFITGLPVRRAMLAARREYLEVLWSPDRECLEKIHLEALKRGLYTVLGGRTVHVALHRGKGYAVMELVSEPALRHCANPLVAVGDSQHDQPMLEIADIAFRVFNPSGGWSHTWTKHYIPLPLEAPHGWIEMAVLIKTLVHRAPSY